MKIPNYNIYIYIYIYHTTHPDETAHGGTAVIIRRNIKHHARAEYKQNNVQATSISLLLCQFRSLGVPLGLIVRREFL